MQVSWYGKTLNERCGANVELSGHKQTISKGEIMSSKNENEDWLEGDDEGLFSAAGGTRAPASESAPKRVSVSKTELEDGGEMTQVTHHPRPLNTPGQIKAAYESGEIDLSRFIENVKEGLSAMRAIVTTTTEGSGKDRKTWQDVQFVPDVDARLKWQEHITATVEGMPVKRQEIISRKLTTTEDMEKKLASSPAARKSLRHLLDKLEALDKAEKKAEKKAAK